MKRLSVILALAVLALVLCLSFALLIWFIAPWERGL